MVISYILYKIYRYFLYTTQPYWSCPVYLTVVLVSYAVLLSELTLFHNHKKCSMLVHFSWIEWSSKSGGCCVKTVTFFFCLLFSIGTFSVCQRRQPEQWLLLGLWESQLQVQHSPNSWICTRVLPRKASWPHYHRSQTFQILWCRSTMSVGPLFWRFLFCPCDFELCFVLHDPDFKLLSQCHWNVTFLILYFYH